MGINLQTNHQKMTKNQLVAGIAKLINGKMTELRLDIEMLLETVIIEEETNEKSAGNSTEHDNI